MVVLEVLSPSSEGDDEGDKRLDFQSVPSLQAYVLVSQDQRRLTIHRRDDAGAWPAEPEIYREGASFVLPMLNAPLSVGDIYDTILDESGRSLLT